MGANQSFLALFTGLLQTGRKRPAYSSPLNGANSSAHTQYSGREPVETVDEISENALVRNVFEIAVDHWDRK
jgi:hypothetical protein